MSDARTYAADDVAKPATRRGNFLIQKAFSVASRLCAGRLTVVMPDGAEYEASSNTEHGPHAVLRINRYRALSRFITEGDFGFVESYLDGDWDCPELSNIIELAVLNTKTWDAGAMQNFFHRLKHRIGHLLRRNSRAGARRNIAAHYDLGNDF